MSKRKSRTILAVSPVESKRRLSGWDDAIRDTEELIGETERQAAELRRSLRSFQELKAAGAPFPGTRDLRSVHTT